MELIERLAREAGFPIREIPGGNEIHGAGHETWGINAELERFAALVAEECIKVVEGDHEKVYEACDVYPAICAAIRAKFQESR